MDSKRVVGWLIAFVIGLLAGLVLITLTMEHGSIVSGIGNSGNHFSLDRNARLVAGELAQKEYIREIDQSDTEEIYRGIVNRAKEGDVDAALVAIYIAKLRKARTAGDKEDSREAGGQESQ